MKQSKQTTIWALGFALTFGISGGADAALVNAGNGMINDTDSNVTWTQDANLFKTMAASNANLVSQIMAVMSSYNDPYHGPQTIDDAGAGDGLVDFDTSTGMMTWWGGQAWVAYLNSIAYGGVTGWRLPQVTPGNGSSFSYLYSYDGSTDVGHNTTAIHPLGSELAHVFYNELGNLASVDTVGNPQTGTGVTQSAPFTQLETGVYWAGTDYVPHPGAAWILMTLHGAQIHDDKVSQYFVWPVRTGQAAVVPVPAALWLMGSGSLALLGSARRQRAA